MNAPVRVVYHDHIIPYRPRRHFLPFHNRRQRWAILVCHRRAGKTVATLNDQVRRAIDEAKPDGRYAFIAPLRNQVKDIAWEYLKRFAAPALADTPNESELRVTLKSGARIRLYGADNPDALRGGYLDGVVLDEYGDMRPSLWSDVVRPMLADRNGWATFIGTPKGKNGFHEVWAGDGKKRKGAIKDPAWFALMLKASESGILPAHELQDARDEMGEDRYAQEFECSFEAAIRGAFYADELRLMLEQGRIGRIPIDPAVPVHTSWDLGVSDSTAMWFHQCVARERRLIDYHEASGVGLDYYARLLEEKRKEHRIVYGQHFLPHDITQRELSTGMSRLDTLRGLGIDPVIVPQHALLDGINATRRLLARTWIDEERCARGLEALRQYRRQWIDRLKDWSQEPLHDWSSHGADALRTFAAGFDDPVGVREPADHHRRWRQQAPSGWVA